MSTSLMVLMLLAPGALLIGCAAWPWLRRDAEVSGLRKEALELRRIVRETEAFLDELEASDILDESHLCNLYMLLGQIREQRS